MRNWTVRPVWRGGLTWRKDRQQLPPFGWCVRCGGEVWKPKTELCFRCRR